MCLLVHMSCVYWKQKHLQTLTLGWIIESQVEAVLIESILPFLPLQFLECFAVSTKLLRVGEFLRIAIDALQWIYPIKKSGGAVAQCRITAWQTEGSHFSPQHLHLKEPGLCLKLWRGPVRVSYIDLDSPMAAPCVQIIVSHLAWMMVFGPWNPELRVCLQVVYDLMFKLNKFCFLMYPDSAVLSSLDHCVKQIMGSRWHNGICFLMCLSPWMFH